MRIFIAVPSLLLLGVLVDGSVCWWMAQCAGGWGEAGRPARCATGPGGPRGRASRRRTRRRARPRAGRGSRGLPRAHRDQPEQVELLLERVRRERLEKVLVGTGRESPDDLPVLALGGDHHQRDARQAGLARTCVTKVSPSITGIFQSTHARS